MILKNSTNDTCLSDEPIDGWSEITQHEYQLIVDSRTVINLIPITVDPITKLKQFLAANPDVVALLTL